MKELIVKLYSEGKTRKEIAIELDLSNYKVTEMLKDVKNYNEDAFQAIDTEEKAYWLGFIHADGYLNQRSLEIELKLEDKDHLEKFATFISGVKRPVVHERTKGSPTARVCLGCRKIVDDLNKLCVKKYESFSPDDLPSELMIPFFRGMFDGDGSIGKDRIDLMGYEKVVLFFDRLFGSVGKIETGIYKGMARIYIHGLKTGNANRIVNQLYDNATIYLERKKQLVPLCWETSKKITA